MSKSKIFVALLAFVAFAQANAGPTDKTKPAQLQRAEIKADVENKAKYQKSEALRKQVTEKKAEVASLPGYEKLSKVDAALVAKATLRDPSLNSVLDAIRSEPGKSELNKARYNVVAAASRAVENPMDTIAGREALSLLAKNELVLNKENLDGGAKEAKVIEFANAVAARVKAGISATTAINTVATEKGFAKQGEDFVSKIRENCK